MKKLVAIFALLVFSFSGLFAQGTLVEDTIILHLNYQDIDDLLVQNGLPTGLLPVNFEVDVHRVIYNTPDVDGTTPTTASGLIFIPTGDTCQMPLMAYLHGTKLKKNSTFYYLNGEWFLGVLTATTGYVMCLH